MIIRQLNNKNNIKLLILLYLGEALGQMPPFPPIPPEVRRRRGKSGGSAGAAAPPAISVAGGGITHQAPPPA